MGCGQPVDKKEIDKLSKYTRNKLNQQQIKALSMIFKDIATRHPYGSIDYENFQLFFRKNGLWAEYVFKEFDISHENLISENQFISGIAKICKQSEKEKARRLFYHFASGNRDSGMQGIMYQDFLRILYNYPKTDLREILNDQYFFEEKIKKNLVNVQNNPYQTVSRVPEKESVIFGLVEDQNQTVFDAERDEDRFQRNSAQKRQAIENRLNASLTFFLYDKKLNVKMTSIHALVKKYAEMIFTDLGLDIKTGQLTQENFISWALNHTSLYKSYYGSFHDYVWGFHDGNYRYAYEIPQLGSPAKMYQGDCPCKKVDILNVKGMLIIHEPSKKDKLLKIVYLDGLTVSELNQPKLGTGILINHESTIYKEIKLVFNSIELTQKWLNVLAYYKGITIYKDFTFGARIGAGKFSVVFEGTQISSQKPYAIKQIQTYKLSEEARAILKSEKDILSRLDHPNFPKFHRSYQSRTHSHIVMELVHGTDLYECLKKKGKFSEIEAVPLVKEILEGVKYLQKLDIAHRDLKPDNIILLKEAQAKTKIKIIDFGFALTNHSSKKFITVENQAVGTPNFIAPEVLEGKCENIGKCDNFAIGAIVYYMLTGNLPFLASDISEVFQKTRRGEYDTNHLSWKKLSQNAKDFITQLLDINPTKRLQISKALKHPWVKQTIIYQSQQMSAGRSKKQKKGSFESQAIVY